MVALAGGSLPLGGQVELPLLHRVLTTSGMYWQPVVVLHESVVQAF